MDTRTIHVSGEQLPVVGLGTWQTFDVGDDSDKREHLKKVLLSLIANGGAVVDSSPMYGTSEAVVGDLIVDANLRNDLFLATKVWTRGEQEGIRQMENSMRKMQAGRIDLMQIHNLVDWSTHLRTIKSWKDAGRIRYWGITHYHTSAYDDMMDIIKKEKPDFIQVNFSLAERDAMKELIPFASDYGAAVIVNRPYSGGNLFSKVINKPLPPEAAEFEAYTWGQVFLKYILSYPEITCVIPGTSKVRHMADNVQAGFGRYPNERQRKEILQWLD